jgi:hypothetical protein
MSLAASRGELGGPHEARRALDELRSGALWLHCSAILTGESADGVFQLPLVHIDPEGRPDVADISRVVRREGMEGSADVTWRFIFFPGEAEGVVDIVVKVPVRCHFRVAISARVHRAPLEQIVEAETVALTTTCPQSVGETPPAVWIRLVELDLLRAALARCR